MSTILSECVDTGSSVFLGLRLSIPMVIVLPVSGHSLYGISIMVLMKEIGLFECEHQKWIIVDFGLKICSIQVCFKINWAEDRSVPYRGRLEKIGIENGDGPMVLYIPFPAAEIVSAQFSFFFWIDNRGKKKLGVEYVRLCGTYSAWVNAPIPPDEIVQ